MKTFITFLLLATALFAKAQIVSIPDANFKAALISMGIDTNNDGEIQQTEADAVTGIDIIPPGGLPISDITGIRSFTNLQTLKCSSLQLTRLDVSGIASLQQLDCAGNLIIELNTTGCTNLQKLFCQNNNLKTLDISNYTNLDSVNISFNDSLDIFLAENCSNLRWVDLSAGFMFYRTIDMVNLINCDSLDNLVLNDRSINILNISRSNKIESVRNFGGIAHFIANNCSSLKYITARFGSSASSIYQSLDVTGCTNLIELNTGEANYLSYVDLSTCPNLQKLIVISIVPKLYVNIKNGSRMTNCYLFTHDLNSTDNIPAVLNVCADDFEIDSVSSWVASHHNATYEAVNINTYCSFTPAGSYNTINGQVKIDVNNNGCDYSDRSMPNVPIKITDNIGNSLIRYSRNNGEYTHYPYTGSFTLTPYFPYPYYLISPAATTVSFDTANSLINTNDFCIQPNGMHNDLDITFLPIGFARPGFNTTYSLIYKNRGTTTLSGNVSVNFDNSRMNFVSASENVATQNTGQLTWNYNNLQPFESRTINVIFNLLTPPVNNIGDTITYLAAITPSANDETAFDNSFILPQRVIGSFDPNDKTCLEGSKLDISKIGDYLHYQIRFQNEGTDTAFNIVVADTLSDKLDWNTFEFIGSSHSCSPQLKNNKAEFIFENINLPYKTIDEPGSNGWVAFKTKPKPSVVIGDSLNNSAAIYFDFNLPVITNTATTIVSSSSTPVPVKLEYFSVNKKENTNQLNWKASCTYGNAAFIIERSDDGIHFKAIGNINATSLRCQLPFNFTDNDPATCKNYYRLKITDADGKSFYSKTLVVGNNKAGVEITAVANNTVYFNSNKQQTIQLKLIASDGKEILSQKQNITPGSNSINLQIKNAAKGIYTLVVYTSEGETITTRFIK